MAIVSGSVVVTDPAAPATKVVQPSSGAVFTSPGPGGPEGPASDVPGPPNVLTIGDVISSTTPGAQIVGESPNQVLNLQLPKGDKGDTGDDSTVPGPPGPANSLTIGSVDEGAASANITGSSPNQVLNLVLPRGPKGDTGPAGEVSQAELDAAISAALAQVIDGSPGALDTLNELAAALGDDPNFAATVSAQIGEKADRLRKVIAGVGLLGGGDLTADRTLSIDFGTGAGKVVEGSDPRLTDARTPISHQHNASDINAGTLAVARLGDGTITAVKLVQAVQDILTKANNATPVWKGTQAAYNAITTKDANTVYVIAG